MGRIRDFIDYLVDRHATLIAAEGQLTALAQKYESFFAEIQAVRERELSQLMEHIVTARADLPGWLDEALTTAQEIVESQLDEQIAALRERHAELLENAAQARDESAAAEGEVRRRNAALDGEEEQLKERNAALLVRIGDYNQRIRSMGGGFGFFSNFFRMRQLTEECRALEREQADVAARIEGLRARWVEVEREHAEREQSLQQRWLESKSEADAVRAKLDYLEQARPRLVLRSAAELALFDHVEPPAAPREGDPACPRCQSPNPTSNHFCHICAQRLVQDRPDAAGSIAEIGEINHHHQRFSAGMKAGQELIGLVRGLISGIDAFIRSVEDVRATEKRYPLPALRIDVPSASVSYGHNFDTLAQLAANLSVRPAVFAQQVDALTREVYTEDKIKGFFETMGEELSRQANAQW